MEHRDTLERLADAAATIATLERFKSLSGFAVRGFFRGQLRAIPKIAMGLSKRVETLNVGVLERAPGEGDYEWSACEVWLRLRLEGSERSFDRMRLWDPSLTEEALQGLREGFAWDLRAEVFDRLCDRRRLEVTVDALEEMKHRQLRLASDLQDIAEQEISSLRDKQRVGGITGLKPRDLVRLIETGAKLERLTRGEVTDRVGGEYDLSKLTDEELELWHTLSSKAKKT